MTLCSSFESFVMSRFDFDFTRMMLDQFTLKFSNLLSAQSLNPLIVNDGVAFVTDKAEDSVS